MFQGHPSIIDMVVNAATMMDKQTMVLSWDAKVRVMRLNNNTFVGDRHLQSARSEMVIPEICCSH